MTKFWDWFASTSLWLKTAVLLLTVLAIVLGFAVYIQVHHHTSESLGHAAYLLLFTGAQANTYGTESAVFHIVLQFAIAIWQSFLLMHILTYSHRIRFSKALVIHSKYAFSRFSEDRTPLVFRLLNQGGSDLYNVKVRVTLRSYASEDDSIDHYVCSVWNSDLSVLRRNMPFRIYVKSKLNEGSSTIDLLEKMKSGDDTFALIVHVEGLDTRINHLKSSVHTYTMRDCRVGDFAAINTRRLSAAGAWRYRGSAYRFISKEEIEAKFDLVHEDPPRIRR